MIYIHATDPMAKAIALSGDTSREMGTCLVADAWSILTAPYGPDGGESFPIVLIAVLVVDGFKVYWGTNKETYDHILAHGIRVHSEGAVRQHFPMLKDIPFVKG